MTALAPWQNFYAIAGTSAGALIGLQFVVLSLIANTRAARADPQAGNAFSTPTIIHFGMVLGLSAMLCAPWDTTALPADIWGIAGLLGILYSGVTIRRMRVQTVYRPEFEDWLCYALLPIVGYATLAVSGWTARSHPRESLFAVAGAALLLLFIGIHNAWDAVTYHVFFVGAREKRGGNEGGKNV